MFKRNPIDAKLNDQILYLLEKMDQENGYTDDYKSMAAHVEKLMEIQKKNSISKETWATIGANLAGIIVIMNHERAHVIASKAFGLVKKVM